MVKTITIIDNDDGTQRIYVNNIDDNGTELIIPRCDAKLEFDTKRQGIYSKNQDIFSNSNISARLILDANCLHNYFSGELYKIKIHDSIKNVSNDQLIDELKNRKILSEEIVYKINDKAGNNIC